MNQELACLHDIAIALSESDLRPSLYKALELLSTSMKMDRGAITIMNPVQHEIRIEAAHGMSAGAIQKGRYKPGEGITGRVIQSGKPTIVPKTSQEPLFLDKTGQRKTDNSEYSFICVPITKGKQVVGCLWVDRPYDPGLQSGRRLAGVDHYRGHGGPEGGQPGNPPVGEGSP